MIKFTKSILLVSAVIICSLVVFTGCDVSDNNGPSGGVGKLTVQLTDAPALYDAVYIDIQSVQVHLNENMDDVEDDTAEVDDDSTGAEGGWVTISDDPIRVDLLQLQNGGTVVIGEEELEAGTYHQIRLILGPDNAVVVNGVERPLKTPSAQQSGLKLNINAEIESNEVYALLIDFNAEESIVETGSGKYKLKPVLRAVALEETGSIEGIVRPNSIKTQVLAINENDTLSTYTEEDGEFELIGVVEGTYDVVIDPLSEAYADTTMNGVEVERDEDTELGAINLSEL